MPEADEESAKVILGRPFALLRVTSEKWKDALTLTLSQGERGFSANFLAPTPTLLPNLHNHLNLHAAFAGEAAHADGGAGVAARISVELY